MQITNTSGLTFQVTDGNGHGTYVAEIIAGFLYHDGRGISAGVKIMPIKVLDDNGNGICLLFLMEFIGQQ